MTKAELEKLSTKDLVALYNKLTNKSIKKFSSRAAGERQTLAAAKKSKPRVRTVRGAASGKNGRPKLSFTVQLTEDQADSNPHAKSARMALVEWLRAQPDGKASIDAIEAQFKRAMRGIVQKLAEKKWVKRLEK